MKKQALRTVEIEALFPSASTAPHERRDPVSLDGGDYSSKPETRGHAALRWFIDILAVGGAGMAGVYVGVWLDAPNDAGNQTTERQTRLDDLNDSFAAERTSAKEQVPAEITSGMPARRSAISTIIPTVPFGADERPPKASNVPPAARTHIQRLARSG